MTSVVADVLCQNWPHGGAAAVLWATRAHVACAEHCQGRVVVWQRSAMCCHEGYHASYCHPLYTSCLLLATAVAPLLPCRMKPRAFMHRLEMCLLLLAREQNRLIELLRSLGRLLFSCSKTMAAEPFSKN